MGQVRKIKGFSLLELLITLLIVAILGAIILPSYSSLSQKSRRHNIQSEMLNVHLQQQSFFLENLRYASQLELALPISRFYELTISSVSNSTFTITASALGAQKDGTNCDELKIDNDLIKQPQNCW